MNRWIAVLCRKKGRKCRSDRIVVIGTSQLSD